MATNPPHTPPPPEHRGPPPSASILASRPRVVPSKARVTVLIVASAFTPALRRAIISALGQSEPIDLLVVDDASADNLSANLRATFPAAKVARNETSLGVVESRNKAAALLTTTIVITLDEHAAFSTPNTVHQTLAEFDHSRIAVVAIPTVSSPVPAATSKPAEPLPLVVSADFNAGASAMRLDIFRALGRYRTYLAGQGEESDLGIRILDAGYICRVGRADPIIEYPLPSPQPSAPAASPRRGARNSILFAWHNIPSPTLYTHWLRTSLRLIRRGLNTRSAREVIAGLWSGMRTIRHHRDARAPVSRTTFRLFRKLSAAGELPYTQIEDQLGTPRAI